MCKTINLEQLKNALTEYVQSGLSCEDDCVKIIIDEIDFLVEDEQDVNLQITKTRKKVDDSQEENITDELLEQMMRDAPRVQKFD